jgi:hypothetical protein
MAAAEDGLLTIMQASAGLAGVTVQLGDPGASPPSEIVWIQEEATADWDPDVTMGPAPSFEEIYELRVKVLTFRSGDDYLTLRNRARDLSNAVCAAVGADRRLNSSVDDSYPVRLERMTGASDVGRGIETTIVVRARVTVA